jgi:hypothetical protein
MIVVVVVVVVVVVIRMSNSATSAEEIAEDNEEDKFKRASATKLQSRARQKCSQEPLLDKIFSQ